MNGIVVVIFFFASTSFLQAGYCPKTQIAYKTCSRETCGVRIVGWKPIYCSLLAIPTRTVYYTCTELVIINQCCPGWDGETCSTPLCFGSETCPNGGTCQSPDMCSCKTGFSPPRCTGTSPYSPGISSVKPDHILVLGEHTVILRCQFSSVQGHLYKIHWYNNDTLVRETPFLGPAEAQSHFITDEEFTDFVDFGVEIYCRADVFEVKDGRDMYEFLEQSIPDIFHPLQMDLSPIIIDKGEEAIIPISINIPFGCSSTSADCLLQFKLHDPTDAYARNKLTVGFKGTKTCGVEVDSRSAEDFPVVRNIVLTSMNDMQFGSETNFNLSVKSTVQGNAKSYWSKDILAVLPVQIRELTSRRRKYCYSHVDPHMRTFDGKAYENQILDIFIMYLNQEKQIQVQTETKLCNGNRAKCSCSCTMKSGGDIFMINHCKKHRTQYLSDKNKSLYVQRINANKYEVTFPTLLRVIVHVLPSYGYTMNIDIYPAPGDRNKVEGLCGNFNGDPNDDFVPRGSTDVTSEYNFAMSWSLVSTSRQFESLQRSKAIQSTTKWNEDRLYCICPNEQAGGNGEAICKQSKQDFLIGDYPDKYISIVAKPWINPDEIELSNGKSKREAPAMDAMSYDEARLLCESAFLDCPVYANRDNVPEMNSDSYLDECALDVAMMGNIDWADPHCEALGSYFVTQLEIDEDFALSLDQTLVNDIRCQICPGNCGGHGTCINCSCVCDEGFGTDTCLVDLNKYPTLDEISPDGVCDIARGEDCGDIVVSGDGFVDKPECMIKIQQADTTGYFGSAVTSTAECSYLEFNEINVSIATSRRRRSVADPVTVVAERYGFSISNNGLNFSDFQYVVVMDSTCQNTSTDENGTLRVDLQSDFCYIDRVCYRAGTSNNCKRCDPSMSSFTWTDECEESDEQANIALICISTLSGVVLLVIIVVLVVLAGRKLREPRRIRSATTRTRSLSHGSTATRMMFVTQKHRSDIDVVNQINGGDNKPSKC